MSFNWRLVDEDRAPTQRQLEYIDSLRSQLGLTKMEVPHPDNMVEASNMIQSLYVLVELKRTNL